MIPAALPRLLACIDLDAYHRARLPVVPALDACLRGGALVWIRGGEQHPMLRTQTLEWTRRCPDTLRARVLVGRDVPLARVYGLGAHVSFHSSSVALARARLGDEVVIGVSCHNEVELAEAVESGANYATLSPIWHTRSKPDGGRALGAERFSMLAEPVSVPVFALGGVTPKRVGAAIRAGAWGVAALGPFVTSEVGAVIDSYQRELEEVFH